MTIDQLIHACHSAARDRGWWDEGIETRSIGDQFANFHAELSEAWEEYRKHGMNVDCLLYDGEPEHDLFDPDTGDKVAKPEGIAAELADTLIRIFDTCGAHNIPLSQAIESKMEYNRLRSYRHGGKLA